MEHLQLDSLTAKEPLTSGHFDEKRRFYDQGHTRSHAFRMDQLSKLAASIERYESQINDALYKDLRKSSSEAFITEVSLVLGEIKHTKKNLRSWMAPTKVNTPLFLLPSSSRIIHEPKGVVLIIAPWNYPFMLSITPLIGAIAAGNCAILKPSEMAPATAAVIETIISETFSHDYISVVQGPGSEVVPALMDGYEFNHIFFTGSTAVGKIIAKAAAEKLVPTTLELGGKTPGIVAADADLKVAARRLVFGKFSNAGQTCVAPEYLLLHEDIKDAFLQEAIKAMKDFYGDNPQTSGDYGRMINMDRFKAVSALITDGRLLHGGQTDAADLYISPTIVDNVDLESPVMQEEIFGPVWPVLTWREHSDILNITRKLRYPLACYVFTSSKSTEKFVAENVEFGGGCINNTIQHLANPDLPFGGVMQSGQGSYHGRRSFETFSHSKSWMRSVTWFDPNITYPPYGKWKMTWLRRLLG